MTSQEIKSLLLALLPEDGRRIPVGELAYRARRLHLSAGWASSLIGELCTERLAAIETVDGWQWVRRVVVAIDFPLRARPQFPAPRLIRTRPLVTAKPVKPTRRAA